MSDATTSPTTDAGQSGQPDRLLSEAAPKEDPAVAEFQKIVEQYQGKQIPIDKNTTTGELIYAPIELAEPQVQTTNNKDLPYLGYLTVRAMSPGDPLPLGPVIFTITYHYKGGQWQYHSVTEQLQGETTEMEFPQPVFKPELLK